MSRLGSRVLRFTVEPDRALALLAANPAGTDMGSGEVTSLAAQCGNHIRRNVVAPLAAIRIAAGDQEDGGCPIDDESTNVLWRTDRASLIHSDRECGHFWQ